MSPFTETSIDGGSASEVAAATPEGVQQSDGTAGDTAASSTARVPTAEVVRVFFNSVRSGALPPEDLGYVSQLSTTETDNFARIDIRHGGNSGVRTLSPLEEQLDLPAALVVKWSQGEQASSRGRDLRLSAEHLTGQ
jgi:hypothetical protein